MKKTAFISSFKRHFVHTNSLELTCENLQSSTRAAFVGEENLTDMKEVLWKLAHSLDLISEIQ